jgi:hypothetical protein
LHSIGRMKAGPLSHYNLLVCRAPLPFIKSMMQAIKLVSSEL